MITTLLRAADVGTTSERLAFAFDSSRDGLWDWNVASGTVWFSESWSRMLGYEPGTVPERVESWQQLVHPDDQAAVEAAVRAHVDTHSAFYAIEHRLRDAEGGWRWVLSRGRVAARDPDGQPLRIVGTHADIHERRETARAQSLLLSLFSRLQRLEQPAAALAEAAAALGAWLDVARVGYGEIDAAGETLTIERDWHNVGVPSVVGTWRMADFGAWMVDERRAGGTIAIADPATDKRVSGPAARAFERIGTRALLDVPLVRGGRLIALLFIHHDRPRRWEHWEVDAVGAAASWLWTLIDHQRALAALKVSEERLTRAVTAAGLATWEWDAEAQHLSFSVGVEAMFGMTAGDLQRLGDIVPAVHPDDVMLVREAFRSVVRGRDGDSLDIEFRVQHLDGGRWLQVQGAVTQREGDGRALRINGVVSDITARRDTSTQLAHAQDAIVRMSRLTAMGALASTLAHELNQPLTAIANYQGALRRRIDRQGGNGDPLITEAVNETQQAALKAGQIINRMRRFAVAGDIVRTRVSLSAIVARAWQDLRTRPEADGINFDTRIPAAADAVEVDPMQFEQVLSNLFRNSIEAMSGRLQRQLLVSAVADPGQVRLAVADTGPGFDAAAAGHLFEPFRTTKPQGTGLGLAICRTIIEAHGGTIAATPGDAGGTIFTIRLPRED